MKSISFPVFTSKKNFLDIFADIDIFDTNKKNNFEIIPPNWK